MVSDPSEALQAFLRDSISSYEELEALLLLVRESGRSWTAGEIARALEVEVEGIVSALNQLAAVEGLLNVDDQSGQRRFQFAPKSELLPPIVEELATAYAEQRLAIVRLMSTNALDRVRSAAIRGLASAFRSKSDRKR